MIDKNTVICYSYKGHYVVIITRTEDSMHPSPSEYIMPAEWAPHAGMLMEWPVADPVWADDLAEAKDAFAHVARTIARFEPLTMIANPEDAEEARKLCGESVSVLAFPHDDCWARDNAPTFVLHGKTGARAGINWRFNAWGGKYPFTRDNEIPPLYLSHTGTPRIDAPIILEGGSIHVNGSGTLLTTEECLLNPNRNPELSRAEIEVVLKEHLGISRIIWLPRGLAGDETDGHVDNLCCFIDQNAVLLPWTDDRSNDNYECLSEARDILLREGLTVETVPQPPAILHHGEPLTLSYINFVFVNGGIVMPSFGGAAAETDQLAQAKLRALFPDREVVALPTLPIIRGGGNIHCITQQIPRASAKEEACAR